MPKPNPGIRQTLIAIGLLVLWILGADSTLACSPNANPRSNGYCAAPAPSVGAVGGPAGLLAAGAIYGCYLAMRRLQQRV
jgi:hypothetical protein